MSDRSCDRTCKREIVSVIVRERDPESEKENSGPIKPGSATQLGAGIAISLFYFSLLNKVNAYVKDVEDELQFAAMLSITLTLLSGIILKAMGFPTDMFTVLFALARTVGWISQWKVMMENTEGIFRPRQLYTGEKHRAFVGLEDR